MKKRFTSFFSAVVVACMAFAQTSGNVVYSWESPEGTVIESGGTATSVMGADDRANYSNAGYYSLCLNGKKANVADTEPSSNACRIVIALDEALQEGDSIYVTAYRNKNADGKKASIYFLYENGTEVNDDKAFTNICADDADADYDDDGAEPTTHGYLVPAEAAGSKTITLSRNLASTNVFITKFVVVRQAAEEEVKTDYTDAIVNADLSTTDAWNTEGTKGIKDGMVKVGSQAVYDFSQTITLPAGQYKMTAKAVYRYGSDEQAEYDAIQAGTETHKTKLYAETATKKYEANVQNRNDGASDADYAAGNGSVTINGKFVPNSSAAVQAWFDAGQYVNELVFNVYEDGQVKVGITTADGVAGDYTNIGAWTLTRLGDAVEEPVEPDTPDTPVAPALDGTYFTVGSAASTLELEKWYLLKSQGRNAYINELTTELRMKSVAELSAVNATDANKGLLFKLAKGSAEGMYNIVSGNGLYFSIAQSSSAVSVTAVDFIVGEVADGVFYMQDPVSKIVADANAAGGTFVGWGTDVPTAAGKNNSYQFMQVEFVDAATAEAIANAGGMLYDLQVAYGLVTDASKFSSNAPETSEGSLGALIDNNYGTFFHSAWSYTVEGAHHLQMEVSEPTESLFFYFKKRSQNNNNRPTDITIFGSNDGENFVEIANLNSGFPTEAAVVDYTSEIITASEAYKHFRFVVNATSTATAFFTFSEFYLFPGNQTIIDAIVSSKALIEAGIGAENFDELKANFEAAYNKVQEDKFNKVFNTAIADAEAILAAASHAEVPALGQYSTAGYTEFEATLAALKNEATQDNLEAIYAAVAEFEATKCLPVFTINGVIDYAAGKSIYENAEGGLNFKDTDLADEAMLWVFDMAETVVGVTEKVVVKNLATGNLFWGAPSIKVAETSEAVAEDGIFLFYTEGNGTEVHAQKNGQAVVRWGDKAATSGSAWTFTYVGTTYDLYDLDAPDWADVTGQYIVNADLASNVDSWTKTDAGFVYEARVAEFYSGWGSLDVTSGSLLQEVTLPAGKYRLSGKAFFRQGEVAHTNPAKSLGYMVAGDNKVLVKTLGSVEGLSAYANSRVDASAAFYSQGLYDNVLEFTLAEETTLNIGFEATFDEMRSWFIVGEVKLERAQPVPGAIVPLFAEQAMAFCQYGNMAMYSLPSVMAKWETLATSVNETYGAIYEGEKVLDAKVVKLMDEMTAMIAELMAIDKYYAIFNDAKWAIYDIQDYSTAKNAETKAAFDAAVEAAVDLSTVTTIAELEAKVAALEAARQAYVVNAVPAEDFVFDYSFLLDNPSFETGDLTGWTVRSTSADTKVAHNSGNYATAGTDGKYLFNSWWQGVYLTQEAADMPNGVYRLTVALAGGDAGNDATAYIIANADTLGVNLKNGNPFTDFDVEFMVVDKKLHVAVVGGNDDDTAENPVGSFNQNGHWWYKADNFRLSYVGALPDSIYKKAFLTRYAEFEALTETLDYSWNAINNTYYFATQEAAYAIKEAIDEVTDIELLDSMITAMNEGEAMLDKAYAVAAEYNIFKNALIDVVGNSILVNEEIAAEVVAVIEASYMAGYSIATIEALEAAVAEIQAAYALYLHNAAPVEGDLFDLTFFINNPSFETGTLAGWDVKSANDTGAKPNSDGTYAMSNCDGEYVFNTWHGAGIYLQQTVKGLPSGTYILKAVLASDVDVKLNVIAGNDTLLYSCPNAKEIGNEVEFEVEHEGGDFLIKVATVADNWFKADNFHLYFYGAEKPVVEVEAVTLDQTEVTLAEVGATVQLIATVAPEDATDKTLTWTSSDEAVVTVDADGLVTAVATGTATITVTTANGLSATCVVTVAVENGIENIETVKNAVIYTISGKRVEGNVKSLEKGIYIVNGKKVLVK